MKTILLSVFFIAQFGLFAQVKFDLTNYVDQMNLGLLSYLYSAASSAKSNEETKIYFLEYLKSGYKPENYPNSKNPEKIHSQRKAEFSLLKKHSTSIENWLNKSRVIGSMLGKFNFESRLPFSFSNKDGKLLFMSGSILYDNVFNTITTTPKKRGAIILQEVALPSLKNYSDIVSIQEVSFLAIQISYPCKDFTEKYDGFKKWECLTIVMPTNVVKSFLTLKTTTDELLLKSDIYIQDKSSTDFKKELLTLD